MRGAARPTPSARLGRCRSGGGVGLAALSALGLAMAILGVSPTPSRAQLAEHCDNDADDDGDGSADCADPDCTGHPACPPGTGAAETTPRACQNHADDDGDGAIDCDDPDCGQLVFCVGRAPSERGAARCGNGRDDDADGATDCDDEGCAPACAAGEREGERSGPPEERRHGTGGVGARGIYRPRPPPERLPDMGSLEHDDPRRYPQRYVQQPLTLLSGMLAPTLSASMRDVVAEEYLTHLGLGASYGILDEWQVTLLPLPLRLGPSFDYENPALSTTLRFLDHEIVEIGAYASVAVPVGTAEDIGRPEPRPRGHLLARSRYSDVAQLDVALLARLHLDRWARIDLALPVVTLVFSEPVRADLTFDLAVAVQLADLLYAGVDTGLILPGTAYEPKVPLGFFFGLTIPAWRRGPAADLRLWFGWPLFFDSAPPPGFAEVEGRFWQLTFDARIYTYLLP